MLETKVDFLDQIVKKDHLQDHGDYLWLSPCLIFVTTVDCGNFQKVIKQNINLQ